MPHIKYNSCHAVNYKLGVNLLDFKSRLDALCCPYTENEPLSAHTTFKIGGPCDYFISPEGRDMLVSVLELCREENVPYYVIGNGSNLLVSDLGVEGAVIHIGTGMSDISVDGENKIVCEAGARLSALCSFALEQSMQGLQFAWGIPGTVGGAIFMNAGAYGGEISGVIHDCTFINTDGELSTIGRDDMQLGYRTSLFRSAGGIITSARFSLPFGDRNQIRLEMDELLSRRRDKQPLEYPSAGSTFKRPPDNYAGTLIEQCGLKGLQIGGAAVSEKHAGFIINKGGCTASDVRRLIEEIQNRVFMETSIKLESEIIFIGR